MSKFGWSYPPGCSGPPDDDDRHHPLSEEVRFLLEEAGINQAVIDGICIGIDDLAAAANRECPICLERQLQGGDDT